jgi:hypothetical protein
MSAISQPRRLSRLWRKTSEVYQTQDVSGFYAVLRHIVDNCHLYEDFRSLAMGLVNTRRLRKSAPGRVVRTPTGHWAYVPDPFPPTLH